MMTDGDGVMTLPPPPPTTALSTANGLAAVAPAPDDDVAASALLEGEGDEVTNASFDSTDQQLLSEMGGEILRKMDGSTFFRENPARAVPTFEKSELGFGRQLGEGFFCSASEIIAISLRAQSQHGRGSSSSDRSGGDPEQALSDFHSTKRRPTFSDRDRGGGGGGNDRQQQQQQHHEQHYDMTPNAARRFMEAHAFRGGTDARYAVKRLKPSDVLGEDDWLKGTLDLAIECKFLAVLNHPNIIKMRGKAAGDPMRPGFFLVLDRLYDTLAQREDRWRARRDVARVSRGCFGFGGKKKRKMAEMDLLVERVTVAYDISSVFRHLHQHKLVYRDIKPDNIGFDVRNDIKVFDFGLCKELSPEEDDGDGLYRMSGLTGCLDFMAPEVALSRPYNHLADVYSFGILLWEIMSLEVPFADVNQCDLISEVAEGGHRPPVDPAWPVQLRELIKDCWTVHIRDRPGFDTIASLLKSTLMTETACRAVQDRTEHMKDRSQNSLRGLIRGSPR